VHFEGAATSKKVLINVMDNVIVMYNFVEISEEARCISAELDGRSIHHFYIDIVGWDGWRLLLICTTIEITGCH
jgi:hypothetical protein